ncbi:GNAT family N-acetyltransferase [Myroides sp. NP-2]|uniref:GNAT family N-acetyltransferase n=1 Tax=Myroides sp. NP-2 TaxID=2759945 RepID=UPI0015FA67E3|nr:GNAT family N-acetyltransferase [Myroides sp. NP-2]MBB1149490.1 GNAT family N-acetyltransferase [Myroides sp. NP-2]
MKIRPYIESDKNALLQLIEWNVPLYFAAEEVAEYKRYLEEELDQYFVVEDEGQLVGAGGINVLVKEKEGRISWDMVAPAFQGKGIGRALLLYRLGILQKIPAIDRIRVRTSQVVYPFYEKYGFVTKQIQKDFWAVGLDLYDMEFEPQKK